MSTVAIIAAVVGATGGACALLDSRISDVNDAVDSVRQDLTTQIDGVRRDLTTQVDGLRRDTTANLEGVRTEIRLLRDRVRAVEVRLGVPGGQPLDRTALRLRCRTRPAFLFPSLRSRGAGMLPT